VNAPDLERGTGDAGTTLIEILMAVILVGIAFVALLAGLSTVALGSDIHRQQADAEVVLTSAAEHLKAPEVLHQPCAEPDNPIYLAAARSAVVPPGWDLPTSTINILAVHYWDGSDFAEDNLCYDTPAFGNLLTLQEITLEVRSPDERAVESITIVQSPPKGASP